MQHTRPHLPLGEGGETSSRERDTPRARHALNLPAPSRSRFGPAFTLIELIVAITVAAGVAGAAAVAVNRTFGAGQSSSARHEAHARAGAVADRIALDVQNLVRSGDLFDARVLLLDSQAATAPRDELLLFSRSLRQARLASEQNEGATYEVQFRLIDAPPGLGPKGSAVLWRRVDPVPDEVPEGGGVASPLVEGVASLSIEAFNGSSWFKEWDSDRDGYPHAIRITAVAQSDDGRTTTPARRTIALDRTPIPYAAVLTPANQAAPGQSGGATQGQQQGGGGSGGTIVRPGGGGGGGGRPGGGGGGQPPGGPGGGQQPGGPGQTPGGRPPQQGPISPRPMSSGAGL